MPPFPETIKIDAFVTHDAEAWEEAFSASSTSSAYVITYNDEPALAFFEADKGTGFIFAIFLCPVSEEEAEAALSWDAFRTPLKDSRKKGLSTLLDPEIASLTNKEIKRIDI